MNFKNLSDMLENIGKSAKFKQSQKSNYYQKKNPQQKANEANIAFDFISLIVKWNEIVGAKLSKNTLPLKIQNNTLIIITSHSIYNSQLQLFEQDILKKIKTKFPHHYKNLSRLSFKASEYFLEMKKNQDAQKEQQLFQENKIKSKDLGHQFDPDFQEKYEKIQTDISKHTDNESVDNDMEDALIRFNLKFKDRTNN